MRMLTEQKQNWEERVYGWRSNQGVCITTVHAYSTCMHTVHTVQTSSTHIRMRDWVGSEPNDCFLVAAQYSSLTFTAYLFIKLPIHLNHFSFLLLSNFFHLLYSHFLILIFIFSYKQSSSGQIQSTSVPVLRTCWESQRKRSGSSKNTNSNTRGKRKTKASRWCRCWVQRLVGHNISNIYPYLCNICSNFLNICSYLSNICSYLSNICPYLSNICQNFLNICSYL